MLNLGENFRTKSSFIIPFFIFAGFFKSSRFSISNWYTDLTFWIVVILVLLKTTIDYPKKTRIRVYNPVLFIVLPLFLIILLSLLFVNIDENAIIKLKYFFFLTCSTVIICSWFIKDIEDLKNVNSALVIFGVFISFYIIINPIPKTWGHTSYLDAGTLTAIAGIISFQRLLYWEKRKRNLYFFAFFISSLGILFSYARGQQFFYAFTIILILVHFLFFQKTRLMLKIMAVVFVVLIILVGFITYQEQLNNNIDMLARFKSIYLVENLDLRIALFKKAWVMFKENPIFFSGLGKYQLKIGNYAFVYPHNMPLEFAAEFGLFGIIFYLTIICLTCWGYLRFNHQIIVREHLVVFFYIILLTLKQGSVFEAKAFWAWSSVGIILLGWRRSKEPNKMV